MMHLLTLAVLLVLSVSNIEAWYQNTFDVTLINSLVPNNSETFYAGDRPLANQATCSMCLAWLWPYLQPQQADFSGHFDQLFPVPGSALAAACALCLCCLILQAAVTRSSSLIHYCSPQLERHIEESIIVRVNKRVSSQRSRLSKLMKQWNAYQNRNEELVDLAFQLHGMCQGKEDDK